MSRTISSASFVVAFFVAASISGCGGSDGGPKTSRVSGIVTLQGKPLDGASVYFMTDKFTGYGKTNGEGKYELVQGAVSGKNKIYISKLDLPAGVTLDADAGVDLGQLQAAATATVNDPSVKGEKKQLPKELVPEDYSNPQKSKLNFDVPSGGTTSADFRL